MGVDIDRGVLKAGTPICVFDDKKLKLGVVETIELNKKSIKEARKETGSVAIRIKGPDNIMAGRHFF
jgi:translation initiation factor 5B